MDVMVKVIERETEKLKSDLSRLQELSFKYKDNIDEFVEFALLYNKLINRRNKYE